jgi:hypothetical protein
MTWVGDSGGGGPIGGFFSQFFAAPAISFSVAQP